MSVPLRHPPVVAARISEQIAPDRRLAHFELRAWARARLWHEGELDLHEAVDILQQGAVENELVAAIGQDAVQAIMAAAFHQFREHAA